jgi:tetratricopeptide (TPR) repeat protein
MEYEEMTIAELWDASADLENSERFEAMQVLAKSLWDIDDKGEALAVWETCYPELDRNTSTYDWLSVAFWIMVASRNRDEFNHVFEVAAEALPVADIHGQFWHSFWLRSVLAGAHELIGNYELAMFVFHEALEVARSSGMDEQAALILEDLSRVNDLAGNLYQARGYATRAVTAWEDLGKSEKVAQAKFSLGNLQIATDQTGEALESIGQAMNIWRFLDDKDSVAKCKLALGKAECTAKHFKKAAHYFEEVISFKDGQAQQQCAAEAMFLMGKLQLQHGDTQLGIKQLRQVRSILRSLGMKNLEIELEKLVG